MADTANEKSVPSPFRPKGRPIMLPNLNLSRPKVALNRWRRWMAKTPFAGDLRQALTVDCALRTCIQGRNDQHIDLYRHNTATEIEKFKSSYAA